MSIKEDARKMKLVSPVLGQTTLEERNNALEAIAEGLQAYAAEIFAANQLDMAKAQENGVTPAVMKRLKFDEKKMQDVIAGIALTVSLSDPLNNVLLERELDADLKLVKVSVPIGVIGVIFEARPDALIQISTLCLKSGNCVILKGGKETANTNKVLFDVIYESVLKAGMPEGCMLLAQSHSEISELLECDQDVDLLIPRGSNAFVRYIMENTKIPVMGHADGVCHIYVDLEADINKMIPIIIDAKTQYTAACNAVETLLIHRENAPFQLILIADALKKAGVKMRGTKEVAAYVDDLEIMDEDDFHTEYLDLVISIKLVDDVKEAVDHINTYGSHHTDAIITENPVTAEYFLNQVDSAGVYLNASTRFADGFRYGFGAEVGISTSKLHARGPVGLDGLITYKYKIYGQGHIVGDYASGVKSFHFKDIKDIKN